MKRVQSWKASAAGTRNEKRETRQAPEGAPDSPGHAAVYHAPGVQAPGELLLPDEWMREKEVQKERVIRHVIRLLLVEDEPLVGQGLRLWLTQAPGVTVIGEAYAEAEALALAVALAPDVVLVDLSTSQSAGVAAAAALHTVAPHCAVVLLTMQDDATRRAEAHAAGARALVGKQEGVRTLLSAIYAAAQRG